MKADLVIWAPWSEVASILDVLESCVTSPDRTAHARQLSHAGGVKVLMPEGVQLPCHASPGCSASYANSSRDAFPSIMDNTGPLKFRAVALTPCRW